MKNKRNEIPVWFKSVFIVVMIVFVLCLVASVVFVVLCSCDKIKGATELKVLDVSVLLAFLTLSFGIAIATPYFITDNKIDSTIREFVKQEFEPDLLNRSEEVTKLDAHLSRMVAFMLLEQGYYAWAIGWSFRALKRYTELHSEYTELYKEFHDFVFKRIICEALDAIVGGKKDAAEKFGEEEAFKITLRAAKDYIDFRYEIQTYGSKQHVRAMKHDFSTVIDDISRKMRTVIVSLYERCPIEDFETNVDGFIFRASRYKQDGENLRGFFYEHIWNEISFKNSASLAKSEKFQKYRELILCRYGHGK
ncbi:MAG: hypothetical protein K2F89_02045 [Treponemataceae bacterium]|nr:hypothetical protein [Treponemataceae bacterium]